MKDLRVFLIDDDLDARDLFTFILQGEVAEVAEVATLEEALVTVKVFQPDIILRGCLRSQSDSKKLTQRKLQITTNAALREPHE